MRVAVAVAAAAALAALAENGGSASGVAAAAQSAGVSSAGVSQTAVAPGARLWVKRYNGPGNGFDSADAVAVSPGGGKVFVSGSSGTIAYRAGTGATLWLSRYRGPDNSKATIYSMAVSPDGRRLFVTGEGELAASGGDYITVAYDTATGDQLWAKRYNGTGNGPDRAASMAVAPGGRKTYVTGTSAGTDSYADYATVAYLAATGAQLWVRRYNGPANRDDVALSVAVSGAGKVFVTGQSIGAIRKDYYSGFDYATIAYSG